MSEEPERYLTTTEETVFGAFQSDRPALEDRLGFTPYVKAITEFLDHHSTTAPLSISVEGEWGSGKTSFMRQLESELRRLGMVTVWFDAWRNEKDESLWASFALEFLRQIAKQRPVLLRPVNNLRLWWARLAKEEGWPSLLRYASVRVALVIVVTVALMYVPLNWLASIVLSSINAVRPSMHPGLKDDLDVLVKALPSLVTLVTGVTVMVSKAFRNVLTVDLERYVRDPNYPGHVALVNHFHEDFRRVVDSYAGAKPIAVFVDDLDRCDGGQASELLRSINLMVADDPKLFFIIGLDREKVAAGYAANHEKLLPYLMPATADLGEVASKRQQVLAGIDFGHSFIEKFIQLPFRVPQPRQHDIRRLIGAKLLPGEPARHPWWKRIFLGSNSRSQSAQMTKGSDPSDIAPSAASHEDRAEDELTYHETLRVTLRDDSPTVHQVVAMVAPVFEYNPRKIKQFINLFRLQALIAGRTGLFVTPKDSVERGLTLQQLGKITAVYLRWPSLLADCVKVPGLLGKLEDHSRGNPVDLPKECQHWLSRPELLSLLRTAKEGSPAESNRAVSLKEVDIPALLRVSPVYIPKASPKSPAAALATEESFFETMSAESFRSLIVNGLFPRMFGSDVMISELSINGLTEGVTYRLVHPNGEERQIVYIQHHPDRLLTEGEAISLRRQVEGRRSEGTIITRNDVSHDVYLYAHHNGLRLLYGNELARVLTEYGLDQVSSVQSSPSVRREAAIKAVLRHPTVKEKVAALSSQGIQTALETSESFNFFLITIREVHEDHTAALCTYVVDKRDGSVSEYQIPDPTKEFIP